MSYLPFAVVRALTGDERHEAVVVETDAKKLRVLKVPTGADTDAFLERGRRLVGVLHPSLRRVRQVGHLGDGRPFVLLDVATGPSLDESPELTLRDALELGLQVTSALTALHDAGIVTGPLRASDIVLSRPAMLDVSMASRAPSSPAGADVRSLVEALLKAGLRRGADASLRARLEAATRPGELKAVLLAIAFLFWAANQLWPNSPQATIYNDIAISSATTVEIIEPDLSGNQLGPWFLERVVGEGAIGRVYLARHEGRPAPAAVKVLKREHATDAEVRHRFLLEALAVNAVKNHHLVQVYDFGEIEHPAGPMVYWAMEFLDGEPLSETLSRGTLEVRRAAHIARQVAQALHAAHQVGVIHRDVKPENVFLEQRGTEVDHVKVLDFGLAKLLRPIGGVAPPGTLAGIVVGTPEYMSPEQAIGAAVDLRSDLFAVGLVLYELLTGTGPYQADTFAKRIVQLTHTIAPRLPALTAAGEPVPAELADLVARCLAAEPDNRFQTGEELARALEPFAGEATSELAPPAPRSRKAPLRSRID